jgi:hypothetical protein
MTRRDEPFWVPLALVGSVLLLALSVGCGLVRGKELRVLSGGGFEILTEIVWLVLRRLGGESVLEVGRLDRLSEIVTLVLTCCCGVVVAWLLAWAAALAKSRAGLWLLALETPFLLYALYWLVLLFFP